MRASELPAPDYANNMRVIGHCDQGGRPAAESDEGARLPPKAARSWPLCQYRIGAAGIGLGRAGLEDQAYAVQSDKRLPRRGTGMACTDGRMRQCAGFVGGR
jgi:hypothetical protein